MLVIEFCSGDSLFNLLHKSDHIEISWLQRCTMSSQVASAMAYLHGLNPCIMHRDLKSPNLLLAIPVYTQSDRPHVKVSDFGVSKFFESSENISSSRMTQEVGTVQWMAPEMMTSNAYTEKVDLYSYGVILYEVICRVIPWDDSEVDEVFATVSNGGRLIFDDVLPHDCPSGLVALMQDCWAQDPADRPAFATVLERLKAVEINGLLDRGRR